MTTADKIGLLTGFGWLAGAGFLGSLLRCWLLTPYGHLLVGLVGDGRLIPLDSNRQFQSFFPGDLFLGVAVAVLLTTADRLPAEKHFYNAWWWHAILLVGALSVAFLMTYGEWVAKFYPKWAILAPSKIYHNFLLYGGYGYVAVSTLVAIVSSLIITRWSWVTAGLVLVAFLCVAPWMYLVVKEGNLSKTDPAALQRKAQHAHVPDWKFLGVIGPGTNWKFTKPSFR